MQILRLYPESTDSEHAFNKIARWSYKHSNLKKKKLLRMKSRISRRKPEFEWKISEEKENFAFTFVCQLSLRASHS